MSQFERILNGALDLFLTAGIKSVTMDDIARHLGMSKKTIYQHFADKNELVTALVKMRMQQDETEMDKMMNEADNVIAQLSEWMRCSEEMLSRMNPILMHDLQKYHPEGWAIIQKFKWESIVQRLEELMLKGIEEGYIRPEIDVRVIARMRILQVESGFNQQNFPAPQFNVVKVQQQFVEHFNYGIVTLEGYQLLNEYQNKLKKTA
ncbi:TetR/AcrR family transcriptional regulator [Mucilaginibacter ginkgonis]|uniref:TetR/AcrR family transcriptional regulator n=1 Tax=Mucilaginibacter ginkgonis TaxID=2682091 RepID=A0A6I4I1E7_9SPHI|nr:TetR/AcrR family transcriptional regulator [Mucilaginibacter ginkgonis]QQL51384.1 TetR/AcrR family transcriptional regulator [Mucilaginibacter ginkgonis]